MQRRGPLAPILQPRVSPTGVRLTGADPATGPCGGLSSSACGCARRRCAGSCASTAAGRSRRAPGTLGTATSSASASGPELDEVEQPQPSKSALDDDPRRWPGQSCTFFARPDYPHVSGNDASGHGAWVNTSNPASNCPNTAQVRVQLQVWQCHPYNPFDCSWYTRAERTQTRYSGQRVAVHYPCSTLETAGWRTRVTVKVIISGWFDKWNTRSKVRNISCHV